MTANLLSLTERSFVPLKNFAAMKVSSTLEAGHNAFPANQSIFVRHPLCQPVLRNYQGRERENLMRSESSGGGMLCCRF
jgi:hypothetical protein